MSLGTKYRERQKIVILKLGQDIMKCLFVFGRAIEKTVMMIGASNQIHKRDRYNDNQ